MVQKMRSKNGGVIVGDLISREAMFEAIDKRERIMRKFMPFEINDDELRPTLNSIREFVKNRPAVDAELVRHGRWKIIEDDETGHLVECSECKEWLHMDYDYVAKYCSECGAKMNMEDEEEKA